MKKLFNLTHSSVQALMTLSCLLLSPQLLAHAEHDKARFVAVNGTDNGRCDQVLRPCRSIAYAVQHANKGDKVLVAAGDYYITDEDQLFLLLSELVPVQAGFNRYDHYQSQAPQLNVTRLHGVPAQFRAVLQQRGFVLLSDGFARSGPELERRLQRHEALQQSQAAAPCSNGKAGIYSCDKIDLVSHLALSAFSSRPGSASDVWGHTDLNTGTEYALIGLNNGTAVVSLADPSQPVEVGTISGSATSWRDIKVYQYFDSTLRRWQAYAYVSSEGSDGLQIIDLNALPAAVSLAARYNGVVSAHNVYISAVDYSTNTANSEVAPLLHIVGQNTNVGAVSSISLSQPRNLQPRWQQNSFNGNDYTHDAASMRVTDGRASSDCGRANCTVLFDFNENDVRLWDISDTGTGTELSRFSYDLASYVHSGWWSEDQQFLFVHDELDEVDHNLNTTLRVFNLNSLRQPVAAGSWVGPTPAIDHNGYVRGNRYYLSNYQRGLTILDISSPAAAQQAGFFDSFVASDSNAFNGMWGVYPYLPSGLILGSDINSGLYVLRDNTLTGAAGAASFTAGTLAVAPGAAAVISVQRPTGSGAVSVAYQTFAGRATTGVDFEPAQGRISWAADDHSDKTLVINTIDSGVAAKRSVFVRLFDPQSGLTLAAPSIMTLTFGEDPPQAGMLGFVQSQLNWVEANDTLELAVRRTAGRDGEVRVRWQVQGGSATIGQDVAAGSGELVWADAETADQIITVQLLDDDIAETDEQFSVLLSSVGGSELGSNASITITLRDDDSNTAPVVNAGEDRQVNAGQFVTLTSTAQDAEADTISYLWQQLSGTPVSLQGVNSASSSFIAPASAGALVFRVTATDTLGASSSDEVTISVLAAVQNTQPASSGGGSGALFVMALLLLLRWRRHAVYRLLYPVKITDDK